MPGINIYQFVILIVMALVILGPERLPQYAQALTRWVRKIRDMAEDAKVRFKDETGEDFSSVDWQKYDPRQYDPRRIIREALAEDYEEVRSAAKAMDPRELFSSSTTAKNSGALAAGVAGTAASNAMSTASESEENLGTVISDGPAPFDSDAT